MQLLYNLPVISCNDLIIIKSKLMKTIIYRIIIGLIIILPLACEPCCWDDDCCDDCDWGDCSDDCCEKRRIYGRGDIVSRTIYLNTFSSVVNVGIADVYITKGESSEITIRAQNNILNVVTYEVRNDELILGIENDVCIESSRGITIDVTTPFIDEVTSVGTGYMRVSGGDQDELYIENTGTGCINAYDLEVDNCYIVLTGTGSCKVDVNDNLYATITGIGVVYYRGNPSISSTITGLGQIVDSN